MGIVRFILIKTVIDGVYIGYYGYLLSLPHTSYDTTLLMKQ
jgi:hypothetical protein